MNIKKILSSASCELSKSGSPSSRMDAEILLKYVIDKSSEYFLTNSFDLISNSQYARFRKLVRRRKKGEPIAYLIKNKEFYGYNFYINKNVLIPRPESELLVEGALFFLKSFASHAPSSNQRSLDFLDMGTGSGCIVISIAKEIKKLSKNHTKYDINFFASDISKKALYVARKNAKKYHLNKEIKFFYSDLFSNSKMPKKYDIIVANLPYVPKNNETQKIISAKNWKNPIWYEPKNAIFANTQGSKIIKKFIKISKNKIKKRGIILIEADPRNITDISIYAKKEFRGSKIEFLYDLSNQKRVIKILTQVI